MEKVWIVTSLLDGATEPFIEGVFASYELAHEVAEEMWKRYNPPYDSYLWKRAEFVNGETCRMIIWYKNQKTLKEDFFCVLKIEFYQVHK